jgi:hypothetical protein
MTAIERRRWHAPPGPTVLHLTRILVALAEQHAIRADQATAGDADPADVELFTCQDTYDKATAGGALELLMVAYWRAQPLTAGVEALRAELTGRPRPTAPRGRGRRPAGRAVRLKADPTPCTLTCAKWRGGVGSGW